MTPLSVLDLAPVTSGSSGADAVRRTERLALHVERLGYRRLWYAEHHNIPSVASTAPEVLIAHAAAVTERIRVGSGGVMLFNHSPLLVAERFATLEALYPGRIDLGLGRAPGSDQLTAVAVRGSVEALVVDDFQERLADLRAYLRGDLGPGHPFHRVDALPGPGLAPSVWLLGSSDYSARLAAALGLRFAFAYHFAPAAMLPALRAYRERFAPSDDLAEPYAMLAVGVICADTDEDAATLAGSAALSMARLRSDRPAPIPSPAEVERHVWTVSEHALATEYLSTQVVGSSTSVRAALDRLLEVSAAEELMIATTVHDQDARLRSYELVMEAMTDVELPGVAPGSPGAPARALG
jgi:luciferase family oxidoreductase group 1